MIRFRVGQSWKREPPGPDGPRDAFALELEGINMLPGANDEPLVHVIASLVDAIAAQVLDGERGGQVSLEGVHLELCFWRTAGSEATISVIDLAEKERPLRSVVAIEFSAIVEATVLCARNFLRDVQPYRAGIETELLSLESRLKQLTNAVVKDWVHREAVPWHAARGALQGGVGFSLRDEEGRATEWTRKSQAALPALLFDGALILPDGTERPGLPSVAMMALAKAASNGTARIGNHQLHPEQVYLAGLEFCLAVRTQNPSLGTNPYIEKLQARCTEGLHVLQKPVPDTSSFKVVSEREKPEVPLTSAGEIRRIILTPRWSRNVALGEDGGRVSLCGRWIVVHSPHAAHALTKAGATAFRHLAARGVAISPQGDALCAGPDRLLLFSGRKKNAQWLRDSDGSVVGPQLDAYEDIFICAFGRKGILGTAALTGRELWRLEPPRTQSVYFSRVGQRVLVGGDDGTLWGLEAADGKVRFRLKASLPVVRAPVIVRNKALVVLNRGEHSILFACHALSKGNQIPAGTMLWTRELLLSTPSAPISAGARTWIGGSRDGQAIIICLSPKGVILWQKTIPCDGRTLSLLPWEDGVLVADARGCATRLLADGTQDWVLGSSGDELNRVIGLSMRRGTLIVPGPVTRLVHPRSGRVVAELDTGPRLLDLASDSSLALYVLKEPGVLDVFAPAKALAIVP